MFESFYGLSANPFRLSADEQFRYAHKSYVKAWSYLKYALEQAEGFVLITGRPGTGKTTLIRDILSEQDESKLMAVNLVTNQFQGEELLRTVALTFGFQANEFNKATLLTRISDYATQQYNDGRRVIILVDEAQNLTENGLEELRLLSNLQIGNKPLFQIFLIGQEETRNLIYGRGLENIKQRILAACRLEPMDARYVENYIEHRLGIAGWDHDPELEPELFPLIHKLTLGVPREVNHLMSRLLLYGALEEKHRLTDEDLWVVVRELDREHRLGIDVQAVWVSYKQEQSLAFDETAPDEKISSLAVPGDSVEAPEPQVSAVASSDPSAIVEAQVEESADDEAHEDSTEIEKSAEDSTEIEEGIHHETDEDSTWVDFSGEPPVLQDVYKVSEGGSPSDAPAFGEERMFEPLRDLPSMRANDVFDPQHHPRLLTDVDDLLNDEPSHLGSLTKRWRWFFYPLLIILLLISLLVPRPSDLPEIGRVVWQTLSGQKAGEVNRQAEHQESESAQQPSEQQAPEQQAPEQQAPEQQVQEQQAEDSETPVSEPMSAATDIVQEELASPPPAPEVKTGDLPQPSVASASRVPHQAVNRDVRVAIDVNHLIHLDESGTRPTQDSLGLVLSALDAVTHDQNLLIVITGVTQRSENPIEQMRTALQQAESLADYLVVQGASRAQISIEGSTEYDTSIYKDDGMLAQQKDKTPVVRLKLIRLKSE